MQLPTISALPERYSFRFCPRCATPLAVVLLHGMERQRGAVERTLTIIDDVLEGRRPCLETVAA